MVGTITEAKDLHCISLSGFQLKLEISPVYLIDTRCMFRVRGVFYFPDKLVINRMNVLIVPISLLV